MKSSLLLVLLLGACCEAPPAWSELEPVTVTEGVDVPLDLADYAEGKSLSFTAVSDGKVNAEMRGTKLHLTGNGSDVGYASVQLVATDACGQDAETNLSVEVLPGSISGCPMIFSTEAPGAQSVAIAGDFNGWSTTADVLEEGTDGSWSTTLVLSPGSYAYKYVENGSDWRCDAEADFIHCDEGQSYDAECSPGGNGCNSLVVVNDCDDPLLETTRVKIDRDTRGIEVGARADREVTGAWATLDGEPIDGWTDQTFYFATSGLDSGRHVIRVGADGAEDLYVPFWLDERDWESGLLYFVFVDRFFDGDAALNESEGADVDYQGGDWAGVVAKLDYLDDLGVTALWLTAPQDNAEGPWDGQCNASYAGYHGYWPSGDDPEEHFGSADDLRLLVDEAHARGMRVMVDWVANHVHETHDWYTTRPEWFNDRFICEEDDDGDGELNWDQRTETCWFAEYLPDIDYTQDDPLVRSVDAAIDFARDYDLDGYRIDAVKHMPMSVVVNSQARIAREIEHSGVGGTEDFRTIGETFDGYTKIAEYIGDGKLDAQFDFPLYYSIIAAFAEGSAGLSNGDGSLQASWAASQAAYGGALMSPFLGNHDVSRFIAAASGEGSVGACGDDGSLRDPAAAPGWSEPYDRLSLAWTFLLSSEGLPLIYYGDEIGLPGYADPDNRQQMRFGSDLSADESRVLAHVQALGQARREHPAMSTGTRVDWWENEADTWAYARVNGSDAVLVILNRGDARTLSNGLSFAGLPSASYVDIFTGERFEPDGDSLSVYVGALDSRVLVPE
ncbi:MAG: hypothetical protein FJ102_00695 [Deltaproteobacteria bacterium]|nr:hypothetical protein [Deltaproteobacteria bacterium]